MEFNFGKNLHYLRKEYKVTQEKLAEIVGKQRALISKWEGGTREPTLGDVIKLADYFNVQPDRLIIGDLKKELSTEVDIKNNDDMFIRAMVDKSSKLTKKDKEIILDITKRIVDEEN